MPKCSPCALYTYLSVTLSCCFFFLPKFSWSTPQERGNTGPARCFSVEKEMGEIKRQTTETTTNYVFASELK